jgi:nucleoside-diphosphate-sugar epimerase
MKIVVTGAAGFIGSHIAETLAAGYDVVGIDNFADHYSFELKRLNAEQIQDVGVDMQEADLADSADSAEIPKDTDVIVHCAAQPGISSDVPFRDYEKNNIQATQNLLNASVEHADRPFFINISTSSVYGLEATGVEAAEPKPASDYGVTKLAAEQLVLSAVRQDTLQATSLRLFSVYGPRERPEKLFPKLIHAAETDEPFPLYEGSRQHVRSFTYVGDVVEAVEKAIDNQKKARGEIINIGTDTTRTTGEAISAVENALDKKIEFDMQPPRDGDQTKTKAAIDKARKLLDWEPKTALEEGVKKQVEWFRKNNISKYL